jgi:hypothetical protein
MCRSILHRLLAAAALLAVAVGSAATGGTWLRCRMTGAILPDCCCPADGAADEGKATPAAVQADDCCDRVITSVDQVPSEISSRDAVAGPALSVSPADTLLAAAPACTAARNRVERSRDGPPTTRAFLLSKSSLLL